MNPPNFVQVTDALLAAVAACEQKPSSSSARIYGQRLTQMRDVFGAATRATDLSYSVWRKSVGQELLRFRRIRVELDRVAALADEHGYDDLPRRRIVYTEREALLTLVDEVLAFLDARGTEWDWIVGQGKALRDLVADSAAVRAEADRLYRVYTVSVKERVAAYSAAVALLREFSRDARAELGDSAQFERARLDNY
jgi:hypothetical protein